jgi:hypothetical protein
MIVVRDVFQLKYGKARDFKAAMVEGKKLIDPVMGGTMRLMSDVVGESYTFVMENTFESLADYESKMSAGLTDEWRVWYQTLVPLINSGRREIFSFVEL